MKPFFIYVLIAFLAIAPMAASASSPITYRYDYLTSVHLPALAVSSEGGGVVTNLTVTIAYPGSGQIYFSSDPATEMDTQSSARIAVLVAANFLGIDYRKYDYFFSMKSPSLIIGGPSASAVMTVGVVAAITNSTVRDDVAMTGMINPDGTIGPVGGIPDKLQAAAQAGYKVFLVPVGQLVVTEQQVVSQSTPFGTVYRTVTKTVNLTQLGETLGVKVIQVTTLGDALAFFLENLTLPPPPKYYGSYTPQQIELFSRWRENLSAIFNETRDELNSLLTLSLPSAVNRDTVNSYVNQSISNFNLSSMLWGEGKYYSSLSSLYQADILLNAALIYIRTSADPGLIQNYINSINQTLNSIREIVFNMSINTFSQLESFLVAMDRLDNAQNALSAAASSVYSVYDLRTGKWVNVLTDPLDLALANMSTFTIQNWISYSELPSPVLSKDFLQSVSDYYLQYAKSVLIYYQSLASEVNVSTDIQTLNNLYNNAFNSYYSGNYAASLYYSVSIVSRATLDLHVLFYADLVSMVKAELENTNSTIGKTGYVSAVVLGYMEQASNYLDQFSSSGKADFLYNSLLLSLEAGIYESLFSMGEIYGGTNLNQQVFTPQGSSATGQQTTTSNVSTAQSSTSGTSSLQLGDGPLLAIVSILAIFIALALYLTRNRSRMEQDKSEENPPPTQL